MKTGIYVDGAPMSIFNGRSKFMYGTGIDVSALRPIIMEQVKQHFPEAKLFFPIRWFQSEIPHEFRRVLDQTRIDVWEIPRNAKGEEQVDQYLLTRAAYELYHLDLLVLVGGDHKYLPLLELAQAIARYTVVVIPSVEEMENFSTSVYAAVSIKNAANVVIDLAKLRDAKQDRLLVHYGT